MSIFEGKVLPRKPPQPRKGPRLPRQYNKKYMALWRPKNWRRYVYGVSLEKFQEMVEKQGGRCACCDETPNHTLVIDHDHVTGKIRALLCHRCNRFVGIYEKHEQKIRKYLERISSNAD